MEHSIEFTGPGYAMESVGQQIRWLHMLHRLPGSRGEGFWLTGIPVLQPVEQRRVSRARNVHLLPGQLWERAGCSAFHQDGQCISQLDGRLWQSGGAFGRVDRRLRHFKTLI